MLILIDPSTSTISPKDETFWHDVSEDRLVGEYLNDIAAFAGVHSQRQGMTDNDQLELPKLLLKVDTNADGVGDATLDLALSWRKNRVHEGMTVFLVDQT